MATQSIPDFAYRPEQYALHNSRPESLDFMWGGIRFDIPPVNVVGPKPAHFDDGTPIPGSLLVGDGYTFGDDQMPITSGPHNWKAKEALRAVLGVTGTQATSQLAKNGVSFLPVVCTREEYNQIRQAGEVRYRASLLGWATDMVQNYEEARNKAKQAGVNATPPGPDFYKAQAILKANEQEMQRLYGAPGEEAGVDDDLEFQIFAKAKILAMAGKVVEEENVDKAKLVERLLQDPSVVQQLRKKYSWRKKGYLDPETNPGAPQPEDEKSESP